MHNANPTFPAAAASAEAGRLLVERKRSGLIRTRPPTEAASLFDGTWDGTDVIPPSPTLVLADLNGFHPGLSFGAGLEHLAVANNHTRGGGRLLIMVHFFVAESCTT